MKKTSFNPDTLFDSRQYGFSQVVAAEGGRHIFFSGQVAWDAEQNVIGEDDLRAQVWQALRNVQAAVQAAGAGLEDVVALRIYIRDEWMDRTAPVREAMHAFFPGDHPPTSTWIGVTSLARPYFLIEIEGTAVVQNE